MIITKANGKEHLGEVMCLPIAKVKAKEDLQIFICSRFRADGALGPQIKKARACIPWKFGCARSEAAAEIAIASDGKSLVVSKRGDDRGLANKQSEP